MLQLTASEVESLPKETKVYEGVGKMCVRGSFGRPNRFGRRCSDYFCCRFVCTPIPDVQKRLVTESEKLKVDMANLDKKEDYLEKTYKNSKTSLEQVLGKAGAA